MLGIKITGASKLNGGEYLNSYTVIVLDEDDCAIGKIRESITTSKRKFTDIELNRVYLEDYFENVAGLGKANVDWKII